MVLGGFTCSKNALIALNLVYIVVGIILIAIGVYARAASIIETLPLVGGVIACGVILILIAILGLVGAVRHHQVFLFFYMIALFILFLVQFSIAVSCLTVGEERQKEIAAEGWTSLTPEARSAIQNELKCCGFILDNGKEHCEEVRRFCCAPSDEKECSCHPCLITLKLKIDEAFRLTGWIALAFSFTEVLAVFITKRYRNQYYAHQTHFSFS